MKNRILFLIALITIIPSLLFSQNKFNGNYKLSHPLKFGAENTFNSNAFKRGNDSIKVVAILVQFQEDNSGLTSGNGRFDLSNKYLNPSTGRDTVIDAPPYDSAYFVDHLEFLQNYFTKSSKGQLNISYDLYGRVITLPKKMEEYSPRDGEPLNKLGGLFTDAWAAADSFINFSQYNPSNTMFIVFHAGVGRDVDLKSILGFDPTPFDIPSVYLGLKNLREFFGTTYNGFQTQDGFFIQNSAIMPSTELRELDLISGNFLLELGINGLICANVGSFLGLPDLFNTSNGKTAIGRFGLMDGQSIFSYSGIFPPEPSAWEKYYLGWVEPIPISYGEFNYKVKTSSTGTFSDSTMYKVLINSSEYFLVENRNRDALNLGQTVYTRNRAFNDSTRYTQDVEGFVYYDISKINGNVTDVTTLDWSLPGLINDTAYYKGGILIWHIDENVINANLANNTVNNNINHRGVDLEEAKGAQLIGVTFNTPFGEVTGDGSYYDFWYRGEHGVPSTIYKNEFTPTSFPSSLSYSLANNNINIYNFDTILPVMTFTVRIGGNTVKPIANFPKFLGIDTTGNSQPIAFNFIGNNSDEIFVNNNYRTYGFNSIGNSLTASADGLIDTSGKYIPALMTNPNNSKLLIAIGKYSFNSNNSINYIDTNFVKQFITGSVLALTSVPLISDTSLYTASNKIIWKFSPNQSSQISFADTTVIQFTKLQTSDVEYITIKHKYITSGIFRSAPVERTLITTLDNKLILNGTQLNLNYNIQNIQQPPIFVPVSKNSDQSIVFVADNKVYALNDKGVMLDNFPVQLTSNVTSGISVADLNSDNIYDLIFVTGEGNLMAYGMDGKIVDGFPVLVGENTTSTPAIGNFNDSIGIIVMGSDGYLYGFKTSYAYNTANVLWKNYLKNSSLSNSQSNIASQSSFATKLPADRVYNWPNPVYDNKTYIRYYLNGNATSVTIKVMDLSGELITELPGTKFPNLDNEVAWDVSSVQSGVYYGVVEAEIDGTKESRIIKIAIVK
ncbi:MAG TPA: T9SS type A sorting domain-containing protein [Ignavibacteria bacterium]|nr:T9SS type A sorting domain-containing protein [Ignavibacteria bacterium]